MKFLRPMVASTALGLAACGGGGSGGASTTGPQATTYSVGGTTTGLSGSGLILGINGASDLAVSTNGSFVFSSAFASGAAYTVTVQAQPTSPSQTCTITSGTGNIAAANVASIAVSCSTNSFTISATVTGLSGSGLTLTNNGGNQIVVAANGAYTFTTPVLSGAAYDVRVGSSPASPRQVCTVSHGSNVAAAANVMDVSVLCNEGVAKFLAVANFTSASVSGFTVNPSSGVLTPGPNSPVPTDAIPVGTQVHPSGRFYFTQNRGAGTVSAFAVNAATGALIPVPGSPFVTNGIPNSHRAIIVSPTGRFLYVLVQPPQPSGQGQIYGFRINDATGILTILQGSPFTVGVGNTGVAAFDQAGKFLYVTTSSPSVGALRAFSVDPISGSLAQIGAAIPIGTYLDEIEMDPAGRFLYLADGILGSLDKIYSFRLLSTGVPELTGATTNGLHTVSPRVDPGGRFLYATGDGGLRQYSIDAASGALAPIAGGPFTGGFYFDITPDGKYLFIPSGNGVLGYSIDQVTGQLTLVVGSPFVSGALPVKVSIDRAGKLLFVIDQSLNTVSSFTINANSGVLASDGSFGTGVLPVTIDVIGTQ